MNPQTGSDASSATGQGGQAGMRWTAPSFLEGVTSGKVGTPDIKEAVVDADVLGARSGAPASGFRKSARTGLENAFPAC